MVKQGFLNLQSEEQNKIIEAALGEFSSNDYDSSSMNQIISNAGISKGSMYHYFHNKEDLFIFILDRVMEKKAVFLKNILNRVMEKKADFLKNYPAGLDKPVEEMSFFEILTFHLEASIQFARENYRYHMIAVQIQDMPAGKMKDRIWDRFQAAFEQYMEAMVDKAMEGGELRKDLGRDFVIRILELVLLRFADIYPNYSELLNKDDQAIIADMKKLTEFLKTGLKKPDFKEE